MPEALTLNKQILVDEGLQQQVLQNPHRALIAPAIVKLTDLKDTMRFAGVVTPLLRKTAIDMAVLAVKCGKTPIGVEFALAKLSKIRATVSVAERASLADIALATVQDKGIALPKFWKEALSLFRGNQVFTLVLHNVVDLQRLPKTLCEFVLVCVTVRGPACGSCTVCA